MRQLFTLFFFCIGIVTTAQTGTGLSSAEIFQGIKKLKVLGSVLYIGAHPDDENNSLLPYLAKEKMYRTAYLSLTRGDGGQNLIGSEQGIELGMIRTQELLAARRIDGAEQYFTTAYEFGFSKSYEEALRLWNREKLLSDMVWVIRKFQPDVIIKRFPPDSRAGHGHHAASAILADEAFTAAADPDRFPEQFKYGVKPWKATRIFWNTFNFGGNNTTSDSQLKIDIGLFNPLMGKSYGEIGGEARTMHKSQGEGRPRRKGQIFEYFSVTAGDSAKNDLFENIDISWNRIGGANIEQQLNNIISAFNFEHPEASVGSLVKLYQSIKALPLSAWRDKKLQEVQELIEQCAGLFSEATTTQQFAVREDSLKVSFFFNKRQNTEAKLLGIHFENYDSVLNTSLTPGINLTINKGFIVASSKKLTQPYWLENEPKDNMFIVKDQALIGDAENQPLFEAVYTVNISGETFMIHRPLLYKVVDPAKGEIYQPVAVLPRFEGDFTKDVYVSSNGDELMLSTKVIGHANINSLARESWKVKIDIPSGWNILNTNEYFTPYQVIPIATIKAKNKKENQSGITSLKGNDSVFLGSSKTIAYDHIPTITYLSPAKAALVNVDVKTLGNKIGYFGGAGDKIPDALEALGYNVKTLTEVDISPDNLKQYDAIVVGVRAYNIYEYLTNKNNILNQYVSEGGNLIVQYIKSNQVGLKRVAIGPYPFSISAGLRVTEENAKVNFLLPQHSVLNYPNKITAADFEGWVQERSTYQVDQSDSHFEFPLGMNDTNDKQTNGSLAIAKYGKGNFAYVSLVLFRQLPAGVPGSYRLLANLIALPKNK